MINESYLDDNIKVTEEDLVELKLSNSSWKINLPLEESVQNTFPNKRVTEYVLNSGLVNMLCQVQGADVDDGFIVIPKIDILFVTKGLDDEETLRGLMLSGHKYRLSYLNNKTVKK